jgi:predicted nucleic acid-binding protein
VIAYIDSSVLLRFVLDQPDPLTEILGFDDRITSVIAEVECLRAVDTARLRGELDDDQYVERRSSVFMQMRRLRRIMPSRSVLQRAGEPLPSPLKTLDAIHVATALQWRDRKAPDLVFATHDRRQAMVAGSLGFDVIGV